MNISVQVKAKVCWWFKVLMFVIAKLRWLRLISLSMACKLICNASTKGFKFRVGNGKWKCLDRKIEFDIADNV